MFWSNHYYRPFLSGSITVVLFEPITELKGILTYFFSGVIPKIVPTDTLAKAIPPLAVWTTTGSAFVLSEHEVSCTVLGRTTVDDVINCGCRGSVRDCIDTAGGTEIDDAVLVLALLDWMIESLICLIWLIIDDSSTLSLGIFSHTSFFSASSGSWIKVFLDSVVLAESVSCEFFRAGWGSLLEVIWTLVGGSSSSSVSKSSSSSASVMSPPPQYSWNKQ